MPPYIDILTLFPHVLEPYCQIGVLGKAQKQAVCSIRLHNIRDFAADAHRSVDDSPYGGGAGMVMKIEPIDRTLEDLSKKIPRAQQHVIVMAAAGKPFTQAKAIELSKFNKSLTLICGRYEGMDQRVIDHLADEALSIGPYVLAGGELAALVISEAIVRLLPGVLGNPDSLKEESFSQSLPRVALSKVEGRSGEYPHYTKPPDYKGWKVPDVLLSGDHKAIRIWREEHRT